jgi:hypothetical protein
VRQLIHVVSYSRGLIYCDEYANNLPGFPGHPLAREDGEKPRNPSKKEILEWASKNTPPDVLANEESNTRERKTRERFDEIIKGDDVSPKWSKLFIKQVKNSFSAEVNAFPGSHLENIHCSSYVRKIEMLHDNHVIRETALEEMSMKGPKHSSGFWETIGDAEKGWRSIYYVVDKEFYNNRDLSR